MKPILATLMALVAVGALIQAAVALAGQEEPDSGLVVEAAGAAVPTEAHDLAVVSFDRLFALNVISGETAAFSFEIANQGLNQNIASWKIVSDNATPGSGDDIIIASGDALLASGFSLKTGPAGIPWDTTGAKIGDHVLTLSVAPVGDEVARGNDTNNSKALAVTVIEQPTHDVAVTAIAVTSGDGVTPLGTADVPSGTVLNVNVTVQNRGTVRDSFALALADETDNVAISSLILAVDSGDIVTVGLPWDTSDASSGNHTLAAEATLQGDENTGDNRISIVVPVTVFLAQLQIQGVDATLSLELPPTTIPTEAQPVTTTFQSGVEQTLALGLVATTVPTEAQPVTTTFQSGVEQTLALGFVATTIPTEAQPVTATFQSGVEQTLALGLVATTVPTEAQAVTTTFQSGVEQTLTLGLVSTTVPTDGAPITALFTHGVDSFIQLEFGEDPLLSLASITSGSGLHLEGRADSTGAFLMVNARAHFVAPDGSFDFQVQPGTYNIFITAPGYIYVALMNINLIPGQVLTIPDITLPFGDANGDGRVGIEDLGGLAANFGKQWEEITP